MFGLRNLFDVIAVITKQSDKAFVTFFSLNRIIAYSVAI